MKKTNPVSSWLLRASLLAALLVPSLAQAHPGMPGHVHSFNSGFAHPFGGLDHLCAMVAVGLWASQLGGRMRWLMPATFVSVMILGGALGMYGVNISGVEQGIAASLLVLGVLVAAAVRLPTIVSAALIGLFALFHGFAHGAEMPATTAGLSYAIGFVIATIGLHLAGLGLGMLAQRLDSRHLVRYAGAGIAAFGIYFCVA
ncbi:MAG: HupE/UreJ family protein [Verrucomicrobia bacterium]|nr:HupE/UreJ family protein [Verrucomicrobiota bacterium]